MNNEHLPIVIVGGGRSGCAKAKELDEEGEHILIFEMSPFLNLSSYYSDSRFNTNAIVQAITPELELLIETEEGTMQIKARQIYLAVGSYEKPMPFPGWTLPGVITKQAAELLHYRDRMTLGKRVVYIRNPSAHSDLFLSDLQNLKQSEIMTIDPDEVEAVACHSKSGKVNAVTYQMKGVEGGKGAKFSHDHIDTVICCGERVPNTDLAEMLCVGETTIPHLYVIGGLRSC